MIWLGFAVNVNDTQRAQILSSLFKYKTLLRSIKN